MELKSAHDAKEAQSYLRGFSVEGEQFKA